MLVKLCGVLQFFPAVKLQRRIPPPAATNRISTPLKITFNRTADCYVLFIYFCLYVCVSVNIIPEKGWNFV